MNQLKKWDEELFLWLNSLHVDWLDPIMAWITAKESWIPLYAILIGALVWQHRKQSIWILLGVALLILCTDRTTSGFMKPFFERLRPCLEPAIADLVYTVKGCGGKYGFASSHAANTFGLAMFLSFFFKRKWSTIAIFLWAAVVSYSRIYAGVHYPGDIIVGGLVGVFFGWLVSWLIVKLILKDKLVSLQSR